MRPLLLTLLIALSVGLLGFGQPKDSIATGQETKKAAPVKDWKRLKVGIAYLNGDPKNAFTLFGSYPFYTDSDGAQRRRPSVLAEAFHGAGAYVLYPLRKWLDLTGGLEYMRVVERYSAWDNPYFSQDYSSINIPVELRAYFLKFFFVNWGMSYTFNTGINRIQLSDTQRLVRPNFLDMFLGIAFKLDIKKYGLSLYINPQVNATNLRTTLRIGANYTLKPRKK